MIDALHISQSGLKATQEWVDTISNNVANMQTAGFKKTSVQFEDLVTPVDRNGNTASVTQSATNQAGIGTKMATPTTDFTLGPLQATYRTLDVAINGSGFIEVLQENGDLAYTRVGRLAINDDGYLTTASGHLLSEQIQVPADVETIEISTDGTVVAKFATEEAALELGQIQLAAVANEGAMKPLGDGLFAVTDESGEAVLHTAGENGTGQLAQGFIEMANVELVEEMTNLVLAQRAYQLNARIIQTADQILETINNLRR